MQYDKVLERLKGFFDADKLAAAPEEWGFFGAPRGPVKVVGCAANITPTIVKEAYRLGVDLLLTHHDSWAFVYGLKEACNALLEEYGMAHAFFHLPLDDANFGTSATLAALLRLRELEAVVPFGERFLVGRIGELRRPQSFTRFAATLTEQLGESVKRYQNNDRSVRRVCVVTGGGHMTDSLQVAVAAGCDTYVTGEYSLYSQQYAELAGMNLMVASHTGSEAPGVRSLGQKLVARTAMTLVPVPESRY